MNPATKIIELVGGPAKAAEIAGTAATAPYRWQYPREKGGTDGLIPQRHHRAFLDHAKENAIPLSAEDFLKPRAEVSA